jgi:O-succinylbenzoate synthase
VKTWIDFDAAPIFAIPLTDDVGGTAVCEGMLIEGPQGWGEFSPPAGCDPRRAGRWLTAAIEAGTVGWPDPLRGRVPVAVSVPAVDPDRAHRLVADAGCRTAAVRVGGPLAEDLARLEAVRDALGPSGAIRCDANGQWDIDTAVAAITAADRVACGIEFVEQPCATLEDVAAVRRRVDVRIAVGQSIRDSDAPLRLPLADCADIAVLTVAPLGGVRRALRVAEACALPCVVAGELQSSIGIAGGLALAGVLPDVGFASA